MSPNIAYYALPMAAWLVARGHWRSARNVLVAVGGLLLGSAIWISANVLSGFDSLHAPSAWAGSSTYLSRFKFFWRSGLPFSLGLRRPWGGEWYGGRYLGSLLYVVALAALVYGFGRLFRLRGRELLLPDLFLIAAAPFVYATFVGNWHLFEGRYTYFVGSMMPILLGRVLQARLGAVVVARARGGARYRVRARLRPQPRHDRARHRIDRACTRAGRGPHARSRSTRSRTS